MALESSGIVPGLRQGEPAVLRVRGEVDSLNADDLHRAIVEASKEANSPVILDATGVQFCDLACLRAIEAARRQIEASGSHRLVVKPSRCLARLMDITGIEFDTE